LASDLAPGHACPSGQLLIVVGSGGQQFVEKTVPTATELGPIPGIGRVRFGKAVRVINADGTCPTTILSGLDSMHFAAVWQPGVGRAVGPINC
jgi:hypothetical protein